MKKLVLLFLLVATLASAASITVSQALELRAGLQALDGQSQVVPQGDAPAKVVAIPYKFSGDARWKIAGALTALKPLLETFETNRTALAKSTGADVDPKNEVKGLAFATAIKQDLLRKEEVKLPTLTRADLNLTDNPIPGSVLDALSPIIQPEK